MISYRLADLKDNSQLLALTKSSSMTGKMALRIDRHPNFFNLIKLRDQSKVFVATEDSKIIGSICVSSEDVYINKSISPLFYICDFKVAPSHRNKGIGLQLTNEVVKYLETKDADFAFLNVSKGNRKPFVFFSDRSHYPDFENIGVFKIFQFIGSRQYQFKTKYNIESSLINEELIDFYNTYYSKHELATVITKKKLENTILYVVRENDKIIAAMNLIDTMHMKQNVVLKLPLHIKYFSKIFNALSQVLKLSKIPEENEPIKMLYIKYFAVANYDKSLINALIKCAKADVYKKSYSFVSLGLHEKDPLIKYLPKVLRFTFYSIGMLVSMKNSKHLIAQIKNGIPYKDYSIV